MTQCAPAEAQLIRQQRQRPPFISVRAAAEAAGISEARWRQIESGYRTFRGEKYPETGPPQTIARMAAVVGVTPQMLADAGAGDAAAELESLLADAARLMAALPSRSRNVIARKMRRDITSG